MLRALRRAGAGKGFSVVGFLYEKRERDVTRTYT